MRRLLLVVALATFSAPATAAAAAECGDPRGPARNVTAVGIPCGDARAFASKVADRGVTRSQRISLPGRRAYTGACLDPSSPDYDCEGGSGNGPDYTGTVRVVGDDRFGLDADGDGVGCE